MDSKEPKKDVTQQTLQELLENQKRLDQLLKNKTILKNLPDKGESIKIHHSKITSEIESRNNSQDLCDNFSSLSIDLTKYAERLCKLEKTSEKAKFKPFESCGNTKEVPKLKNKVMEGLYISKNPTVHLSLPESLERLKGQEIREKSAKSNLVEEQDEESELSEDET